MGKAKGGKAAFPVAEHPAEARQGVATSGQNAERKPCGRSLHGPAAAAPMARLKVSAHAMPQALKAASAALGAA